MFGYLLPQIHLSVIYNGCAPYLGCWNFRQYFFVILYLSHLLTSVQNFMEIIPQKPLSRGIKRSRGIARSAAMWLLYTPWLRGKLLLATAVGAINTERCNVHHTASMSCLGLSSQFNPLSWCHMHLSLSNIYFRYPAAQSHDENITYRSSHHGVCFSWSSLAICEHTSIVASKCWFHNFSAQFIKDLHRHKVTVTQYKAIIYY